MADGTATEFTQFVVLFCGLPRVVCTCEVLSNEYNYYNCYENLFSSLIFCHFGLHQFHF